jgi:hypothetical protein
MICLFYFSNFLKVAGDQQTSSDILPSGQCLRINQKIVSSNSVFFIIMQSDGNFVLYNSKTQAKGTLLASGGVKVCMLTNGLLVMFNSASTIVWTFPIAGIIESYAQM